MAHKHMPGEFEGASLDPIIRLWMLRILVPLNAVRTLQHAVLDEGELRTVFSIEIEMADNLPAEARGRKIRAALDPVWRQAESQVQQVQSAPVVRANIGLLAAHLGLSETESALLEFASMLHTNAKLNEYADGLGGMNSHKTVAALAVILAYPDTEIRKALSSRGRLAQSGVLNLSQTVHENLRDKLHMLSEQFCDAVASPGMDLLSLLQNAVAPSAPAALRLNQYPHLGAEIRIARDYLASSLQRHKTGTNVLIYGPPGTGKTELARALAADLGCDLFEVAPDGHFKFPHLWPPKLPPVQDGLIMRRRWC